MIWSGEVYVGLVTFVHSPTCINAALFNQQGHSMGGSTSILYNEDRTTHMTWSWPPFVAPAKKDE